MPTELYPVGTVVPFGGGTVPAGWTLCDGSAVSRTGRADLFAVISTDYGVGDGSTTFNVPDLRLRLPVGASAVAGGGTGGALNHTHTSPSHGHTATQPADHGTHSSLGTHTHDAHTTATRTAGANTRLTGPGTHSSDGAHTHDAHSAHSGFAITSGGSGPTGTANPPFLAFDFIIASHNTFTQSFNFQSDHHLSRTQRTRISHSVRSDHFLSRTKDVTKSAFNVRSDHMVDFDELLTLTRSFSVRQDHFVTRTQRTRIAQSVRSNHITSFARSLDAARVFSVRSDHFLSRSLGVSTSHNVRSDHFVSMDRSLVLHRTFQLRSNHLLTVETVKIFVRTFSTRQNHFLSARICLDTEDLPDPGAGGGTTIIKRLFIFDD